MECALAKMDIKEAYFNSNFIIHFILRSFVANSSSSEKYDRKNKTTIKSNEIITFYDDL